ncbi:polysaccharide pyruvyl transferase family protein [Lachnospiraceae bacterium SGI.085]
MMKKDKIAVLTIPTAENYGSVLQAYALKKFLCNHHIDADVINYLPEYLKHRYPLIAINKDSIFLCGKSFVSSILNFKYRIKKRIRFNEFRKEYIELSNEYVENIEVLNNYKCVMVGGDQLWNTRITKYNTDFFLKNVNVDKKIAFSVSMGYKDRTLEEDAFYQHYINNFDYIYVREKYDVDYLKNIVDNEKALGYVLDPTLLVEKDTWNQLCNSKRIIKQKYILVYMFNDDENVIKVAKQIKKALNIDIYVIRDSYRKYDKNGFVNLKNIGPLQFVRLFKDADYIITNSFHGTVFSIIFEKNFNCIPYHGTEGRMLSLLEILNLSDAVAEDIVELDYETANTVLQKERKKAIEIVEDRLGEYK